MAGTNTSLPLSFARRGVTDCFLPEALSALSFQDLRSPASPPSPDYSVLPTSFFFFLNTYLFILFLVALGLRCCMRASSSCGEQGLPFVAVHGLLIAVASLVVEHGLWACGLQ